MVEIPDNDSIFHVVYDINDRFQIPGQAHLREGSKNRNAGGVGGHWRGIYDDRGRIMIAISYNSDMGDAWALSSRWKFHKPLAPGVAHRQEVGHDKAPTGGTWHTSEIGCVGV